MSLCIYFCVCLCLSVCLYLCEFVPISKCVCLYMALCVFITDSLSMTVYVLYLCVSMYCVSKFVCVYVFVL